MKSLLTSISLIALLPALAISAPKDPGSHYLLSVHQFASTPNYGQFLGYRNGESSPDQIMYWMGLVLYSHADHAVDAPDLTFDVQKKVLRESLEFLHRSPTRELDFIIPPDQVKMGNPSNPATRALWVASALIRAGFRGTELCISRPDGKSYHYWVKFSTVKNGELYTRFIDVSLPKPQIERAPSRDHPLESSVHLAMTVGLEPIPTSFPGLANSGVQATPVWLR